MYGLSAVGRPTVPVQMDVAGTLCGAPNSKYQAISASLPNPIASFRVPSPGTLPVKAIVVAANGGSDYFYVPSHDPSTVAALVKFLQQREEFGAILVDSRYGDLPGTLSIAKINLENAQRQGNGQPDAVVSFNWDLGTSIQGLPGIEFESAAGQRGMHGSFGIADVHNTLIARGPSFKASTVVTTPTGNVDVAPTTAYVLGLAMPQADGRVINEALTQPASFATPVIGTDSVSSTSTATGLRFELPSDPTGRTSDPALAVGSYGVSVAVKDLKIDGKTYRYFDYAKAVRQ